MAALVHQQVQHIAIKDFFVILLAVQLTSSSVFRLKGYQGDTSGGSLQQGSGISTGSSCLSYANTGPIDIIAGVQDALGKAFANISPISPLTTSLLTELNKDSGLLSSPSNLCGVRADDICSGSSGFDNKTYSILIPSLPQQIMVDSSEIQMQDEVPCDSAYHPIEGDVVICADQQLQASPLVTLPPVVSSLVATDMSYQQCNADSVRFSLADDSSLSSISSGSNATAPCDPVSRVEAACECSDEAVGGAAKPNAKMENVPTGSRSFPPVDDDYQAFQSLVEQPDILFSEKQSGEDEGHLNKYPEESFTETPGSFFSPVDPGFTSNVQGGSVSLSVQRPFLPLLSADKSVPVITDSGYLSV